MHIETSWLSQYELIWSASKKYDTRSKTRHRFYSIESGDRILHRYELLSLFAWNQTAYKQYQVSRNYILLSICTIYLRNRMPSSIRTQTLDDDMLKLTCSICTAKRIQKCIENNFRNANSRWVLEIKSINIAYSASNNGTARKILAKWQFAFRETCVKTVYLDIASQRQHGYKESVIKTTLL